MASKTPQNTGQNSRTTSWWSGSPLLDQPLSRRRWLQRLGCGAVWAGLPAASACGDGSPAQVSEEAARLRVRQGRFQRDGQPLRAIGVNYFDCFSQLLTADQQAFETAWIRCLAGFDDLQQLGIPFIRFNAGGFYPVNWRFYEQQPGAYFQRLQDLTQAAQQRGLGLIPSLFWTFFTQPGRAGEPISAWGRRDSQTHQLMTRYVSEVVGAIGGSQAVWAWEFGNEYNLEVDLPNQREFLRKWFQPALGMPAAPSDQDVLTSRDIQNATEAFAAAVRLLDPHRPIFSGHACPRSAAWHLEHQGSWTADSQQQWGETLAGQNRSLDALSIHFYPFHPEDGTGPIASDDDPTAAPQRALSHGEHTLRVAASVAQSTGQPLWVGEFGPAPAADAATRLQQMQQMIDWMEAADVGLAAAWVYDYLPQPQNNLALPENRPLLELVGQANARWAAMAALPATTPATAEPQPDWVQVTPSAAWRSRDSQGEVVFDGRMWLFGGWHDSHSAPPRDVWSSRDGADWELVEPNAPWIHSDLPMSLAFRDRMWMMGGWYNGRLPGHSASNEVWSSVDGRKWTQETDRAAWSARLAAGAVEFQGKMWILGGTENYYFGDASSLKNDVWVSDDGKHWEQVTPSAPWAPRAYHQAVVLGERIYVMGGGNYVPEYQAYHDVWSSDDGVHWREETSAAPWHPRIWFSSVAYRNHLWLLGGWSNHPYKNWNDVWYSADGSHWSELQTESVWRERHEHSAYVFQDKLWVAGGMVPPLVNDVWSLQLPADWSGQNHGRGSTR